MDMTHLVPRNRGVVLTVLKGTTRQNYINSAICCDEGGFIVAVSDYYTKAQR